MYRTLCRRGPGDPQTIWAATATPANPSDCDPSAVNVGVKFKSDVNGYITGIRFYKSTANTGTHIGALWTSSGTRLATATFANETASGWQQVNFATPVPITANTVYVASYLAPRGRYANDDNYFAAAGADNGPLHALRNGVSGRQRRLHVQREYCLPALQLQGDELLGGCGLQARAVKSQVRTAP